MIKYGLISETDGRTIEKTIWEVVNNFPKDTTIYTTEVGVFDGQTSRGLNELIKSFHRTSDGLQFCHVHTAIDNEKDKPILKPFPECNLIKGNSNEVYNQLEDNSQHLIFVDGCHCFAHVISDFFCYAPKVKVGGFIAFHDTGKHIKPMKDFQHGDKNNPDAYISVRKALKAIGLIEYQYEFTFGEMYPEKYPGWELVFDEADSADLAGGVTVFKKLY